MTTAKKPVQMCCLTLNYTNYVMPADKGMKVVALMQSAVPCEENYEGPQGFVYRAIDEHKAVEFKLIQASQLRGPKGAIPAPRLSHEPLKLTGRRSHEW